MKKKDKSVSKKEISKKGLKKNIEITLEMAFKGMQLKVGRKRFGHLVKKAGKLLSKGIARKESNLKKKVAKTKK